MGLLLLIIVLVFLFGGLPYWAITRMAMVPRASPGWWYLCSS
jgi:hypothetical protein